LIHSGLAGIEGNIIGGGDGEEKEEDSDTGSPPVFRERSAGAGEEKEVDDEDDEDAEPEPYLVDVLKALSLTTKAEEEMKIVTLYVPNVALRGEGLTIPHRGLLMLLDDLPPGARIESVNIIIDEKDSSKGYVDVDISPSLSVPEERFPEEWTDGATGNPVLVEMFCNQLQARYERDSVQGSMPPFVVFLSPFVGPRIRRVESCLLTLSV
jgi:hypothetical protein